MPAELRAARNFLEVACVGTETEVMAAQIHHREGGPEFAADEAAAVAIGAVNPVVQAVLETVQAMLLVPFDEPGEERLAFVGFAITVGVLGVENLRRGGDQEAIAPREQAGGKIQVVEEDGGFVVSTIA